MRSLEQILVLTVLAVFSNVNGFVPSFASNSLGRSAQRLKPTKMVAEASKSTKQMFEEFIDKQAGQWASERTYHYINNPKYGDGVERSTTVFDVSPLDDEAIQEVAEANNVPLDGVETCGFSVSFYTEMKDRGEKIRASTNVVFIPEEEKLDGLVEGFYLRSSGYEWDKPTKSRFTFRQGADIGLGQLQMKTVYDTCISVDQITLLLDNTRLRRIVNFALPEDAGIPPDEATLVGFGVEIRS